MGFFDTLKSISPIKSLPKGIKDPNAMIKNKHLYMGSKMGSQITPTGQILRNKMGMYFGGIARDEGYAVKIEEARNEGFPVDQLEVRTGLTPDQIQAGLSYIRKHPKLFQGVTNA